MYSIVDLNQKTLFTYHRPSSDINKIIEEFTIELTNILNQVNSEKKIVILKSILNLIWLCEEPTKNYYEIEKNKIELKIGSLLYYFHFNTKRISKSNQLIEAIPALFDESESSYFFHFLTGVKHSILYEIRDIEKTITTQNKNQSDEAKFFREAFKTDAGYKYIITELSKDEHGHWFDDDGNFLGTKRKNDNQSATGTLVLLLIQRDYLKNDLQTLAERKIFIKRSFNVDVGERSTSLKSIKQVQFEKLSFIKYHKFIPPIS